MSKKFLGKVIAAAALGGVSLLVWAPSTALADGGYRPTDGYQHDESGRVDGGSSGVTGGRGDNLAVAGVGMLGMAALGGLGLMRQRRTDDSAS